MLIKKTILPLVLLAAVFLLFACTAPAAQGDDGTFDIVCTVFAPFDWVQNLTADCEKVSVTLLAANGADLHSYQPTAADIARIAESDLLIYVGGESDRWAYDAAQNAAPAVPAVSLTELLGERAKTEELVEGMQDDGHDHDGAHGYDDAHSHDGAESPSGTEIDEHVWLSPKTAAVLVRELADRLSDTNADNADRIRENAKRYLEQLAALDEAYTHTVQAAPHKVFVVADRFPFRYLADDYGLTYYAAFPGCSAETDAGFHTVIFLAEKLAEQGLTHIAVTESADAALARAVCENSTASDVQTVVLDSMQTLSEQDIASGADYLDMMRKNLAVLQTLLS